MKKSIHNRLAARKRRIASRLERKKILVERDKPVFSAAGMCYELGERVRGIAAGGIGGMQLVAAKAALAENIDRSVHVLKRHLPYHESDHVLNIALNLLVGGTCLEHIELRRNDEVFLDALGVVSIPDPTTAGDFCRRFELPEIHALMDVINLRPSPLPAPSGSSHGHGFGGRWPLPGHRRRPEAPVGYRGPGVCAPSPEPAL